MKTGSDKLNATCDISLADFCRRAHPILFSFHSFHGRCCFCQSMIAQMGRTMRSLMGSGPLSVLGKREPHPA